MKKISRSHRKQTQRGGFPFGLSRKTTPASRSAEASRHFVNRSATPCCDARGVLRTIAIYSRFLKPATDPPRLPPPFNGKRTCCAKNSTR